MWFKCDPSEIMRRWPYRSLEKFGTFSTLYFACWDSLGFLDDVQTVAQITGLPVADIEAVWQIFKQSCIEYNGRLLPQEMAQGLETYKAKKEAGSKAAQKRWTENKDVTSTIPITRANAIPNTTATIIPNAVPNTDKIRLEKNREENTNTRASFAEEQEILPNQRTPLMDKIAEVTGERGTHWKTTQRLREAAIEIQTHFSLEQFDAFCAQLKKTPGLGYLVSELGRYCADEAKKAVTQAPASKNGNLSGVRLGCDACINSLNYNSLPYGASMTPGYVFDNRDEEDKKLMRGDRKKIPCQCNQAKVSANAK